MDDLISRADTLEALKYLPVTLDAETIQRCIEYVSNMQSIQPEIIRCKDCNNYWDSADLCCLTQCDVHEDDFCSRAERKQDG